MNQGVFFQLLEIFVKYYTLLFKIYRLNIWREINVTPSYLKSIINTIRHITQDIILNQPIKQ